MSQLTSCKAQLRSPSSTRDYSGSQPASIDRHDPRVRSDGQLNRQIPSEWPENTDSLDMMPERCRHPSKMSQGRKKALPSRMPQVDADPSKMAQGSFRPLWDGKRKMQILLGWCVDYADSSSMVHGRRTSHQDGKG